MKKINKYRYLIKNIGVLTISNFSSKIMIFLLVPLYTSVLSTNEYGIFDLIISTVQLLFPLLTLNITDAIMRFSMENKYSINEIVTIGLKYIGQSYALVGIFLLICNYFKISETIKELKILIFFYFVFYVLLQFLFQLAKGLEKIADIGIASILSTIILVSANIIFLLFFKLGLLGFFLSNILSNALSSLYLIFKIKIWKFIRYRKQNFKLQQEMLRYCSPLIFSVVGWWINNTSDKYVVSFLCGTAANGLLSISYKIPSILNTFQSIFIQAWQISAVKEYKKEDSKKFYGNMFVVFNALMTIIGAVLILLTRPIGKILYLNEFYAAWIYVPFLLISGILNAASGFLGPILSAKLDTRSMAKSAVYGAVTNIVLNIVFVWKIGIQGATIATVVASYIMYLVRKKAVGEMIKIEQNWKIYIIWFILCVQAICEILMVEYFIEIILIILLIFFNLSIILKINCYK